MTKGSRSLNGLFIASDLFQTAAVKTIMFSHRCYGGERGQTGQVIISGHAHHHDQREAPRCRTNDKLTAVVTWDFMDRRRSVCLPLGGSTEGNHMLAVWPSASLARPPDGNCGFVPIPSKHANYVC